jgi:hypothetical protein
MAFGAGDEAVERGGSLGGMVMFGEEPVLVAVEGYFLRKRKRMVMNSVAFGGAEKGVAEQPCRPVNREVGWPAIEVCGSGAVASF